MMASSSLSRGIRFEEYVVSANDCVHFKMIANDSDLNDDLKSNTFHPEFTHQFFGDTENIFGYRDLKVKLFYSVAYLNIYLGLDYAEKVDKQKTSGVEADDVMKTIVEKMEANVSNNLNEFRASLAKESSFKPYGQLVDSFAIDEPKAPNARPDCKRYFDVFRVDVSHPAFVAYHQQMQTFLLWFIDAASYIDIDDDRWDFFVMYEKRNVSNKTSNGHFTNLDSFLYHFVGYTSIYKYYAYPFNTRPRISQFLILPPFQRRGLGAKLLQSVYNCYGSDDTILDITVEDPSDNFTRIRDYVDCVNLKGLVSFRSEQLRLGWNEEMAKEAQNKFKVSKRQARHVYEILRFGVTDKSNEEEYKNYRIAIKQRLNAPYQKQQMDLEKLEREKLRKEITDAELLSIQQSNILAKDVRIDLLNRQYKEHEEHCQHIIERLALC